MGTIVEPATPALSKLGNGPTPALSAACSSTTISGGGRSDAPADNGGIGALPNLARGIGVPFAKLPVSGVKPNLARGIGVPFAKLPVSGVKRPSADDGVARLSAELGVMSAESGIVSAELGVWSAGVEADALSGVNAAESSERERARWAVGGPGDESSRAAAAAAATAARWAPR